MVVPEERHLFLQRPAAVEHPEQPALARIVDDGRGRKCAVRCGPGVPGRPDLAVHIIRDAGKVDELVERGGQTPPCEVSDFVGTRAEPGTSKDVHHLTVVNRHTLT